ncbi:MAG: hypothetical protein IPP71_17880 [Bacteroidetes bacterium]|nr:hypothetical protein [Bacteroidota bacterium]
MLITVNTIPVDTTRAIKDLKGQIVVPYSWKDALPYVLVLLIVGLVAFLIYRYFKKRSAKITEPVIRIPRRPAHEIALEALAALDASKLWQNGNYKGYYTELSDIIRTFIQNRWSLAAMEMTTDEVLKLKIAQDQNQDVFQN